MENNIGQETAAVSTSIKSSDTKVLSPRILRRSRGAGRWTALTAGTAIFLLGLTAWLWQPREMPAAANVTDVLAERTIIVEPQAVSQHLDITGTISAETSVVIVAPFDGVIREKRVQLGDPVQAGDVLIVMDTSEIASRYRDAQSTYLKAAMAADTLQKWSNGPDMLRARRSLEAAQAALATLDRQVVELKALLDQGIVSRNEYDGLVQQHNSQMNAVASAKDELASTQTRGNDENRQLVMLELENAQSRLNDLKQQMAGSKVATAVAGILTRPPVNASSKETTSVEPGASVARGSALFAIADTSSFAITGFVDEVDVNRVKISQPVTITSDAFPGKPVIGRIVNVSAEGSKDDGRSAPSFEVRAAFSVDNELRQAIRIGMSAMMTVETYANPAAFIVPSAAIVKTDTGYQIRVRRNREIINVPILTGATFPEGIEVISGIFGGEDVLIAN